MELALEVLPLDQELSMFRIPHGETVDTFRYALTRKIHEQTGEEVVFSFNAGHAEKVKKLLGDALRVIRVLCDDSHREGRTFITEIGFVTGGNLRTLIGEVSDAEKRSPLSLRSSILKAVSDELSLIPVKEIGRRYELERLNRNLTRSARARVRKIAEEQKFDRLQIASAQEIAVTLGSERLFDTAGITEILTQSS